MSMISEIGRPHCGHCGLARTADGHDGCLQTIHGAMNACCGHGGAEVPYIQYGHQDASGRWVETSRIAGDEALSEFCKLGIGPGSSDD